MEKKFSNLSIKRFLLALLSIVLVAAIFISANLIMSQNAYAGSYETGSTSGSIKSYVYVPDKYDGTEPVPLYVSMHGCSETYSQFASESKINTLADEKGFLVLHLSASSNYNQCFSWYSVSGRSNSELTNIISIVTATKANYAVDADSVFCFGLSAGGAMAYDLLTCYPDVFAGAAIGAGLPFKNGATSLMTSTTPMLYGPSNSSTVIANAIYDQFTTALGDDKRVLPMILFHGTSDGTVNNKNSQVGSEAWAYAMNLIDSNVLSYYETSSGSNYTVYDYKNNETGKSVVQYYSISGMGHAWACPSGSGTYNYSGSIDATRVMYDFFIDYYTDETPPVTTASKNSGTYDKEVTVALSVNEEATTYYTTDGTEPTTSSNVYTEPLTFTKSTVLKFFSVDTSDNAEEVKSISYYVNNPDYTLDAISISDAFKNAAQEYKDRLRNPQNAE